MGYEAFLIPFIGALAYSVTGYLKRTSTGGESFDGMKMVATVFIGGIVGVIAVVTNIPITEETVAGMLVSYAGLTALVENILKAVYAKVKAPATAGGV